ncbi:hypothetical protein GQ54DRAFT_303635 [Martensiomyces pterosporus]|nr:hypothetical protein GQ54DRAFT_303635 [Martensiomyces pterosporus]
MPVNNNTDLQFYRNMWVRDYLYPVCDYMEPHCSIVCNRKSTWKTLDKKTMCFTNIIKKEFKQIDFFIKLDDDAIVDRDYIFETMEKYKDYREPVYISDFILNLDGSNLALNGSYYGNGKFYMFNRRLVDCIDTAISSGKHAIRRLVYERGWRLETGSLAVLLCSCEEEAPRLFALVFRLFADSPASNIYFPHTFPSNSVALLSVAAIYEQQDVASACPAKRHPRSIRLIIYKEQGEQRGLRDNVSFNRRGALVLLVLGVLATTTLLLHWGRSDGRPWSQFFSQRPPKPVYRHPLAIIMPVNEKTDLQFYRNMWTRDFLHPVCDFDGPQCSIACNQTSTWETLDKKTICFANALRQNYADTEFFIKLDDDALVDHDYVFGLMEKYRGHEEPVYISDFILNLDGSNPALNGSHYGNGKFYMFNRRLVDCLNTSIEYTGQRNEDAVFGAMVYNGCGPGVMKIPEDDSKIWHKNYTSKNKHINLAVLINHENQKP